MAMLNNQRVYIYIYQLVQPVCPKKPSTSCRFFSQLCTESLYPWVITPWGNSKRIKETVWICMMESYSEHGFPHMFPMLFHVSCRKKLRLEMCKLPAAYHPHVGRSNEVFAPCPDPWELESWSHIPWWEVGNNMRICLVFLGSEIL